MSKIKSLLVIFLSFFVIPSLVYAQDARINGAQQYSFSLQSTWKSMPSDVLKDVQSDLPTELQTTSESYDSGYFLSGQDYLSFPFILIEHKASSSPEYKKLEELTKEKTKVRVVNNQTDITKEATDSNILFNPKTHMLAMKVNKNVPGQQNTAILSIAFLGIDNYIQFNMYADVTNYPQYSKMFNVIINSFTFFTGYGYVAHSVQPEQLVNQTNPVVTNVLFNMIGEKPLPQRLWRRWGMNRTYIRLLLWYTEGTYS